MTDFILGENQTSTDQAPQVESTKGQGYINTNYFGNIEAESQQQTQVDANDQALIDTLSQKLGLQNQTPETQTPEQEDEYLQKLETEEGRRLAADFKNVIGIDLQEAFGIIQDTARLTKNLDAWRQQIQIEQQAQQLKQEWGQDFDVIMPKVTAAFQKLPPQMQKALDNPDGARLLAAQIRQQERGALRGNTSPYVPSGNVRSLSGGAQTPVIKMSEMVTWSGQEMDRRMPEIIKAKQAGTLINDL